MKMYNTHSCEACESNDSQSFKLLSFPCGTIPYPKKKADRLIFVISGRLSVTPKSEEPYLCNKDEVFLLVRDKTYDVVVEEEAQLLVLSFVASYQICDRMGVRDAMQLLDSIDYKFHTLFVKKPLKTLINSVLCYLDDNISCGYWQKAKRLEMFVVYWNYYTMEEITRFFYPVINKDIGFHSKVMAHGMKARTVTELASLCGYSLTTFNKLFKENFEHTSPYKWMLQQNVPLVRARLLDRTIPIKNIATEFGFIDQSHLNRYCKRYLNATPFQIRNLTK